MQCKSMSHDSDGMFDQNTTEFRTLPLNLYKWFRLAVPNCVVGLIYHGFSTVFDACLQCYL